MVSEVDGADDSGDDGEGDDGGHVNYENVRVRWCMLACSAFWWSVCVSNTL
jgi:hypothetical protein